MEATLEQQAEGLAIVSVLAGVLDRLVIANAAIARTDPGQVTKFHAMKAPGICVQQYLERIHKYASCSNESFILALIYIDRLIQRNNFLLTELNVHRVVITAVLLAAKFFDDAYYNNAYYAKVGGVLVSEINGLEVDFLFRINFSLRVTPDEFDKYRAELLSHLASGPPQQISAITQTVADQLQATFQQQQQQQPIPQMIQAHIVNTTQSEQQQTNGTIQMDMCHNDFVQTQNNIAQAIRLASQITPSPKQPMVSCVNNSNNLQQCNNVPQNLLTTNDILLQSLEFLQQNLDGNRNNTNNAFVALQRTNSMPAKIGAQFQQISNANVSFPVQQQQICSQNRLFRTPPPPPAATIYPPVEEQYLRLLMENQLQSNHHVQNNLAQQQQQQQHFPSQHQPQHPFDTVANNNYVVLQNEARRLAAQNQLLAGLTGVGM